MLTTQRQENIAPCKNTHKRGYKHHRRRKIDKWGDHIHIFVFTDLKNNRFQKKLIMQNTNI